jgi:hypothetical protein
MKKIGKAPVIALCAALIVPGLYFLNKVSNKKNQIIANSIAQSEAAIDDVTSRFSAYIDSNKDMVIDATELRPALDKMGYRDMIGSATKFSIYDPDVPDYPIGFSSEPRKKFQRSDIYRERDVVYIPISAARLLLSLQ